MTPDPETQAALDRLREVAEAATPGPWFPVEGGMTFNPSVATRDADVYQLDSREWIAECSPDRDGGGRGSRDAAFIAAANPTTVLALLDRLQAAQAAVARVRALADEWGEDECSGQHPDPDEFERMAGFRPVDHWPIGYAPGCDGCASCESVDRVAKRLRAALDGDQP